MTVGMETQVFSETEWLELQQDLSLSPRQTQVVEQLLCGRSDKQIADELGLSVPTVRTHLGRLFVHFDVEDRCELILRIFMHFRERCREAGCPHFQ